jgi:hypothetical protein
MSSAFSPNSADLVSRKDILSSLCRLDSYVRNSKFEGFDPYDALNSPFLGSMHGVIPRVMATQFFVYSPINLRKSFHIPMGKNPKAIALFLSAYCNMKRKDTIPLDSFSTISQELVKILQSDRTSGYSGWCWGFNFDWQDITRLKGFANNCYNSDGCERIP